MPIILAIIIIILIIYIIYSKKKNINVDSDKKKIDIKNVQCKKIKRVKFWEVEQKDVVKK